jgi:alkylation response protein AidB-like acyl-CoA dehydrogenase
VDFNYSQEQQMLADSLRRFIETSYTFETRRENARKHSAFNRAHWAQLAEIGVLGLCVASEFGGFGESAVTQMVVQRELGRGLVVEPVIPSAVIATAILSAWGVPELQAQWLPRMSAGEAVVGVAWQETAARFNPEQTQTVLAAEGQGYILRGAKTLVWHGAAADAWLVFARLGEGFALVQVERGCAGVELTEYPTMDGQRAADLRLDAVRLPANALVVGSQQGLAALQHGLDHGIAALCASAAGAMERLVEITAEYVRTRHQFGQPLGALQVVQHRVADMLVHKELALSMAYVAVQALGEADAAARCRMLSGAKITIARAGRLIGQQAVQLHGGMGMTDALAVGDYFKYLTLCDPLLGDSDHHLRRYAAALAPADLA